MRTLQRLIEELGWNSAGTWIEQAGIKLTVPQFIDYAQLATRLGLKDADAAKCLVRNWALRKLGLEDLKDQESKPIAPGGAEELPDKLISDTLELSIRTRRVLQRMNIRTLRDLTSKTEAELKGYKNFTKTPLNEVKQELHKLGLKLKGT